MRLVSFASCFELTQPRPRQTIMLRTTNYHVLAIHALRTCCYLKEIMDKPLWQNIPVNKVQINTLTCTAVESRASQYSTTAVRYHTTLSSGVYTAYYRYLEYSASRATLTTPSVRRVHPRIQQQHNNTQRYHRSTRHSPPDATS